MSKKPRNRGRPSDEGAADLTAMIVEVALEDFAKHGYEAASIDKIAARCRASKHTIYRRFPSKEALFEAAVAKNRQRMILDRLALVKTSEDNALGALREITHAVFEIAVSPGSTDLYRMCIGAIPRFPRIGDLFAESNELIYDTLEPWIRRAQRARLLKTGDTRKLAAQLHYTTVGQIWARALLGEAYLGDATEQAALFESNWQLFLNGARPKTAAR